MATGIASPHAMALIINIAPTAVFSSKTTAPFQNPLDSDEEKMS